ncbi:MAG: signal peptidase I [Treponema sp.]|jgi:signal peptidase I|nr:signal peptidase I [Treponema sp.]
MFNKWRKYSYAAQKDQRHQIWWALAWFLAFFVVYIALATFGFSTRVLENDTMLPGLRAGDRFIVSSNKIYTFLAGKDLLDGEPPFRRGNVALVDMSLRDDPGIVRKALDVLLRFFTLQRVSLFDNREYCYIKRIIGLPGDEISMTNFVLRIKPAGETYSLTEFELSDRPYVPTIPQVPALWDESIPFSGNMDARVLGENECFVLSDDRSNTNDSRTWGPIPADLVAGQILFRYWPLTRLGRP